MPQFMMRLYSFSGSSFSNLRKISGYRAAVKDAGYAIREELMVLCHKDLDAALERLDTLSRSGVHFDAVLASEDILAVAAVKYADKAGLKIPQDLSIIGYNNSILSRCPLHHHGKHSDEGTGDGQRTNENHHHSGVNETRYY